MQASQALNPALAHASAALADAVAQVARSVVAVHASRHGAASGLVWRAGTIVSSASMIRRDDGIRVTLADGSQTDAVLAGVDPSTDLAVLKVESALPEPADIGDADTLRAGNFVFAVGRDALGHSAASFGIIGAVAGEWRTWRGGRVDRMIRLDGKLYAGFNGGPIADTQGQVIGIGTSGLLRGFGVAIPSSTVSRVVEQLLANGRIAHGYLGIGMQSIALPETIRSKLDLHSTQGLIVLSLAPQGPAEEAGVLVGDILIELAGKTLQDVDDLHAALGGERIGERVRVGLVRGGQRVETTVTLAERPRRRC